MPLLLLVAADSHARVPTELARALNYPCLTGFSNIHWSGSSSWHSSCLWLWVWPCLLRGAMEQQGEKGRDGTYFPWFPSLGCTKTVVIISFFFFCNFCLSLMITGGFSWVFVYVCSRWILSYILFQWHNFAVFIISLVLRVIYNEVTCSFVFGFVLEEFAFLCDVSGKAI